MVLLVDDDCFDEVDWLAEGDALAEYDALSDDEARADDDALAVADVLAEGEDAAACVGAELGQVEFGVGRIVVWAVATDVGLGLGDAVGVGVLLGLALGLAVTLGLLVLALEEAPALGLVVLPLLWLPLADVAGAVAFPLGLLAALVPVNVTDGLADGDGQELGVV